jgi:ribosomal protein L31
VVGLPWLAGSEQAHHMMYLLEVYEMREIKLLVVAVEVDMDRHTLYMAGKAYILARVARKDRFHQNRTSIITSNTCIVSYGQYI